MQKRLLKESEDRIKDIEMDSIVNLRVTYKNTRISDLEDLAFNDVKTALQEIKRLDNIFECLILQTCNRIEIYARISCNDENTWKSEITGYWQEKIGIDSADFHQLIKSSTGYEALLHLLRLTCGLESMVIGEDQILGQIETAYKVAKEYGAVSSVLKKVFDKAIRTGKTIRSTTRINKGAVSMGSIAVNHLEESIHDITGKKIMIIGAGETSTLVGKALATRKIANIVIINRTYEKAVKLANSLGGKAVQFRNLKQPLISVDAVIVATAAPHYILTRRLVAETMKYRGDKKLIIIDLSQPRNVEENVADLPNVELHNIDNLREISKRNLEKRLNEIEKTEDIINDALHQIIFLLKKDHVEQIITAMCRKADEIRCKEVNKAMKMMRMNGLNQSLDQEAKCQCCVKIVEDLSYVMIERLLNHPITNLRRAAIDDESKMALIAQKLFKI